MIKPIIFRNLLFIFLSLSSVFVIAQTTLQSEDFEDGMNVLAPGWSLDDGTTAGGNIGTGSTSDGATLGNGFFITTDPVPGGAYSGFTGFHPIFDDCFTDNIGVGCVMSPEIDLSGSVGGTVLLSMNWQNEAFTGFGDMTIDVWDGTSWVTLLTAIDDSDSAEDDVSDVSGSDCVGAFPAGGPVGDPDVFDISCHLNSEFQLRVCYDDQGFGFGWGMGFDNVLIEQAAVPPIPTVSEWGFIIMLLSMLIFSFVALYTYKRRSKKVESL